MTIGKTIALAKRTFVSKVLSLLFTVLSRLVIAFLPREQASFNFTAAVTICSDFEAQKIKSVTVCIVSPSLCHEVMGPDSIIFVFWMLSVKPTFSLSSFTFIKRLFSSSSLSAIRVVSSAYQSCFNTIQPRNSNTKKPFCARQCVQCLGGVGGLGSGVDTEIK